MLGIVVKSSWKSVHYNLFSPDLRETSLHNPYEIFFNIVGNQNYQKLYQAVYYYYSILLFWHAQNSVAWLELDVEPPHDIYTLYTYNAAKNVAKHLHFSLCIHAHIHICSIWWIRISFCIQYNITWSNLYQFSLKISLRLPYMIWGRERAKSLLYIL